MAKARKIKHSLYFPTREQILTFIKENPESTGKREIGKAFGIKGQDRIALKSLLKEMADDGLLESRNRKLTKAEDLPSVLLLDIVNTTSDGDLMTVPVKWDGATPPPSILLQQSKRKEKPAGVGDRVLARIIERNQENFTAHPIKTVSKAAQTTLGIVRFGSHANEPPHLIPINRKQSECDIEDLAGAKDGDLVSVTAKKSGRYGLARARVQEIIGSMRSEKAMSAIALHEHDIPVIFPAEVLIEVEEQTAAKIDRKREDWRDLPLITIDPADAKDHDDAVYAQLDDSDTNKGGHVITIAIADVSYHVRPNTARDSEARKRGNSTYFPDRVVPMLPERISNNLCSLIEGEDRPALAARIVLNAGGHKIKHSFHRIMMRSPRKLSYQEAQAAIDGTPNERTNDILDTVLKPLWAAYECLKIERKHREPLDLNLPERKLKLAPDGTVEGVHVPERLDAHKLIEEFMILANVAAAEMLETKHSPIIYRIHEAPSLSKMESLREFLGTLGIKIPKAGALKPHHFNGILHQVTDTANDELTNQVVLRSQSQAEYNTDNIGHFGLNLSRYAHFTSPIRRYADLMVHRALVSACKLGEGGLGDIADGELSRIAEDISATERRSMAAERDTIDRLISDFLSDQIGASFWGRINGVTKSGLFITLDDSGADGFVPISKLGDDYYYYEESARALIGERSGQMYIMGNRVEVKLVEAAPYAGSLRFDMLSDGIKGKTAGVSLPKRRGKRQEKHKRGKTIRRGR